MIGSTLAYMSVQRIFKGHTEEICDPQSYKASKGEFCRIKPQNVIVVYERAKFSM